MRNSFGDDRKSHERVNQRRRDLRIEPLEDRLLLAATELKGVLLSNGDLLNTSNALEVAPRELRLRFRPDQVIDKSSLGAIEISRAGVDGFDFATANTDFNSGGAVGVDFTSTEAGNGGEDVVLNVTKLDLGPGQPPTIGIVGSTLNISLNTNLGSETTAQELVDTINGLNKATFDFNTGGTAEVEFSRNSAAVIGHELTVRFTKSDHGQEDLPTVVVNAASTQVSIDLNTNIGNESTASEVKTAIDNQLVARTLLNVDVIAGGNVDVATPTNDADLVTLLDRLVTAAVVSGNANTDIATPDIIYSPIALAGADDELIQPGFIGVGDAPNENDVIIRFAGTLPDDLYAIDIGSGLTSGETFDGSLSPELCTNVLVPNCRIEFELNLGPQIIAVVPQAVARNGGVLEQQRSQIDVYFNDDDLDPTKANDPLFYQLFETRDTATNVDDVLHNPDTVVYDAVADKAVLTFSDDLANLATGTFRLRIGTTESRPAVPFVLNLTPSVTSDLNTLGQVNLTLTATATLGSNDPIKLVFARGDRGPAGSQVDISVVDRTIIANLNTTSAVNVSAGDLRDALNNSAAASALVNVSLSGDDTADISRRPIFPIYVEPGSSFANAHDLSTLGSQALIISSSVDPQDFPLDLPGSNDEPGHRAINIDSEKHISDVPSVASDFNTAGAVVVELRAQRIVPDGSEIVVNVTRSDHGAAGLPAITLNGFTIGVDLNTNASNESTAQDLLDAIAADALANELVSVVITQGTASTNIGSPAINYSPLRLSTADSVSGITTQYYNFRSDYGSDPDGTVLTNLISDFQKTRAREIFEIYGTYLGVQFVETDAQGFTIATGDLRAIDLTAVSTAGGRAGVAGTSSLTGLPTAVMDSVENWDESFGANWFGTAMHEIGHLLGLGHANDLPESVMAAFEDFQFIELAEPIFPGSHDIVHGQHLFRPDGKDIDLYEFDVISPGVLTIEIIAERRTDSSLLDSVLTLFSQDAFGTTKTVAQNDDYFSEDSFLELSVSPGTYFIGVSASGNAAYDPTIEDSGFGGTSDGPYDLRLNFRSDVQDANSLTDIEGQRLDGDGDGVVGGIYNYWFQVVAEQDTLIVDKSAPNGGTGGIGDPFNNLATAITAAVPNQVVRVVGNNLTGDLTQRLPYEIGFENSNNPLTDGSTLDVPQGVTLVIDAGAVFKFQRGQIGVGSSAPTVDRSRAAIQVLGTPVESVFFTSYNDATIGADTNPLDDAPARGDWGGIAIRNDVDRAEGRFDYEERGIFLNYINHADMRFGGGKVVINSVLQTISPVHMTESRPTVTFNTITNSADAAMSADLDSFEETILNAPRFQASPFEPFTADYRRIGPEIHGNLLVRIGADGLPESNSKNGLFVRVSTAAGGDLRGLTVPGRFDDRDIVHVVGENLVIQGTPGGPRLFTAADKPPIQLVGLAAQNGGTLAAGDYQYKLTFVTKDGYEGIASDATATLTASAGQSIRLSPLPPVPEGFVARRVYRSTDGGVYEFVDQIAGSSTSFLDTGVERGGDLDDSIEKRLPRLDARLRIDPNIIVKVEGAVIESTVGAQLIAEGLKGQEIIITSLLDDRFGAGGTFDTGANNDPNFPNDSENCSGQEECAGPGDWAGIFVGHVGSASIDHAIIAYGGGVARVEGSFTGFNALEIHQAKARVAHTRFESNAEGVGGQAPLDRFGRGPHTGAAVFVRNAQPILLENTFVDTQVLRDDGSGLIAPVINIDVNSLNYFQVPDSGRVTGEIDRMSEFNDNQGPLIRKNVIKGLPVPPISTDFNTDGNVVANFQVHPDVPLGSEIVVNVTRSNRGVFGLPSLIVNSFNQTIDVDLNSLSGSESTAQDFVNVIQSSLAASRLISVEIDPATNPNTEIGGRNINYSPILVPAILHLDGMVIRGGTLTTQGVWDDVDMTHIVFDEIVIPDFHTFGGLRLESGATESLVVKLQSEDPFDPFGLNPAGFTATGRPLEITDRIGGVLQVIGQPGLPVVLTSLKDDSVGAGLDVNRKLIRDVNNDGDSTVISNALREPAPGDWRSVRFEEYSHDRNVDVFVEPNVGVFKQPQNLLVGDHATANTAQFLGLLAKSEQTSDDSLRLGFEVHGFLIDPEEVDVYSFSAVAGTEVWIELDRTTHAFDSVVELIDVDDNVLAMSTNSLLEGTSQTQSIEVVNTGKNVVANVLGKSVFATPDRWSTNPRDAGFRTILPGAAGTTLTYHLRVRANQANVTNTVIANGDLRGGSTRGQYQLQVRLRELDEIPGSTVRRGDIRYATNGVEAIGLPAHSPLLGEVTEQNLPNDSVVQAQQLGNLLNYDRSAISIAGGFGASYNTEIIDNIDGGFGIDGSWTLFFGPGYLDSFLASGAGIGDDVATWIFAVQPGIYRVSATWPEGLDRATDAPFTVTSGSNSTQIDINQRLVPNDFTDDGVGWEDLDPTFVVTDGSIVISLSDEANGLVVADGIRVERVDTADWFEFKVEYDALQNIPGFTDQRSDVASYIFDLDYADGLGRSDASIALYGTDADGVSNRLLLFGTDSNVTEDQPKPLNGADAADLSVGSFGQGDPYIGPVVLPEGTYFLAVFPNSMLPQAVLDTSVRFEPINSLERIAEDHVESQGGSTFDAPIHADFLESPTGLWHQTSLRGNDAEHGLNAAYDGTRTAAAGDMSWYFGDDATANYDTGNPEAGDLFSKEFSLRNYSAADQPVLYFNYLLETDRLTDLFQLFIDDGAAETLLAENRTPTDPNVHQLFDLASWRQARIPLDAFAGQDSLKLRFNFDTVNAIGNIFEGAYIDDVIVGFAERGEMFTRFQGGTGDTTLVGNPDSTNGITVGEYQLEIRTAVDIAGPNSVLLRDFDTNDRLAQAVTIIPTGTIDQSVVGTSFVICDRADCNDQDADHVRFIFRDAAGAPSNGAVDIVIQAGFGEAEIIDAIANAINSNDVQSVLDIQAVIVANAVPASGLNGSEIELFGNALVKEIDPALPLTVSIHGIRGEYGDSNRFRDQGQVLIDSNSIQESASFGVVADALTREAPNRIPRPGPVRNLHALNTEQLTAGVTITNNLIFRTTNNPSERFKEGGIKFSGDAPPFRVTVLDGSNFANGDDFSITDGRGETAIFEFDEFTAPLPGTPACNPSGVGFDRIAIYFAFPLFPECVFPGPDGIGRPSFDFEVAEAVVIAIRKSDLDVIVRREGADVIITGHFSVDGMGDIAGFTKVTQIIQPAPVPFGRIVNNTIVGTSGTLFNANDEPNDFINPCENNGVNIPCGQDDEAIDTSSVIVTGLGPMRPGTVTGVASIGDNPNITLDPSLDVDIFAVQLDTGNVLDVNITSGGALDAQVTVFDSSGSVQDQENPAGNDAAISFTSSNDDLYYVAVSSAPPTAYDPEFAASGPGSTTTGEYIITITVKAPHSFVLLAPSHIPLTPPRIAEIADGETFSISDLNSTVTFEYDEDGLTLPGNVPVFLSDQIFSARADTSIYHRFPVPPFSMSANMRSAIFSSGLDVTTSEPESPVILVNNAVDINFAVKPGSLGLGVIDLTLDRKDAIAIDDFSSPTLLNNVVANYSSGVFTHLNSGLAVLGATLFAANGINTNVGLENRDHDLEVGDAFTLFTDPGRGNFYPKEGSPAIDSSVDSLQDRDDFVEFKSPLGIGLSPILAPRLDVVGQVRSDDPNVEPPDGFGQNVFKDRGALDHVDFTGPIVEVRNPRPKNESDKNVVLPAGTQEDDFRFQFLDGFNFSNVADGLGIDDSTITPESVTLLLGGVELTLNDDYTFSYDATSNEVRLVPAAGKWQIFGDRGYEIRFLNNDRFVFDSLTVADISVGQTFAVTDLKGNTVVFEFTDGPPVTAPNVSITFNPADTPIELANAIIDAINGSSLVAEGVTASVNASTQVVIENVQIVDSIAHNIIRGIKDLAGNSLRLGGGVTVAFSVQGEQIDFGDAPDTYGTTLANQGARHFITADFQLGSGVDSDEDGKPGNAADDDDLDDGVTFNTTIHPGANASISIVASAAGFVDAWIDFDRNGIFDASDQILTSQAVVPENPATPGAENVFNQISIPPSADEGSSFARFRFSSSGGLPPTGEASDGEVEDFAITIAAQFPHQNPAIAADVDNSGFVNLLDLVLIVQDLVTNGPRSLPVPPRIPDLPPPFRDPNGDNTVSIADIQPIVVFIAQNGLNLRSGARGEGEPPEDVVFVPPATPARSASSSIVQIETVVADVVATEPAPSVPPPQRNEALDSTRSSIRDVSDTAVFESDLETALHNIADEISIAWNEL